jgi:hypothetical protein
MADEFFISLTLISTLRMRGESRGNLRMPGRAGRFAAKNQLPRGFEASAARQAAV